MGIDGRRGDGVERGDGSRGQGVNDTMPLIVVSRDVNGD